ncbi:XdhC/CoxI family protein [Bacillus sp. B15-48]|uniref:XdhC family protein n=1 Tax=Bacillus sp. B15-48 TaxID=1548601 RepID=UPI0019401C9B|nr:XdhC/CoxI family protein [Bacillus sp. B15-48]
MLEILIQLRECWIKKESAVLGTIIDVEGSVYRKEGARCLIHQDGQIIGIVSGGCIEKDLYAYAQEILENGNARLVDYDFRPEDDLIWGMGVGCNGALTILLQPFEPVKSPELALNILESLERIFYSEHSCVVGTVVSSQCEETIPVGRMLQLDDGQVEIGDSKLCKQYVSGVSVELFIERIKAQPRLVIFGGGEDAKPLAHIAHFMEWHVTIVDHRTDVLNRSHFPNADAFILASREGYGDVRLPKDAAAVIMTHNYEIDKMALCKLIFRNILYLGQLGPRKRMERMIGDLQSSGYTFEQFQFEKLHSPIGLDIGAETPQEIALCIVAEICARRNNRSGLPLREKELQLVGSFEGR